MIVEHYLKQVSEGMMQLKGKQIFPYNVVLEHGIHCPLDRFVEPIRRGRMRECYANSVREAMERKKIHRKRNWIYMEGYAFAGIFPCCHAWLASPCITTFTEPTWTPEAGYDYYGIPFTREFMSEWMDKTKLIGNVLDNLHLAPDLAEKIRSGDAVYEM